MEKLYRTFAEKGDLHLFISPLVPFLDSGSLAYEYLKKFGYVKHANSLMDHYRLIEEANTWIDLISYETTWLSKSDIANVTYNSVLAIGRMKFRSGLRSSVDLREIEKRIVELKRSMVGGLGRRSGPLRRGIRFFVEGKGGNWTDGQPCQTLCRAGGC